jgi:hypothetical protein
MTLFSGIPSDLCDAVAYELDAIEYLRTTLHEHDETPVGGVTLTLGDLTPDGELRRAISAVGRTEMSGAAVRAALNRLRPLAFSASFKLQDMVVEWILRANNALDWSFSKKLNAYDKLRKFASLVEPVFLATRPVLARAFWELYRFLVPFRGAVVHSGGVILGPDGTVSITKDARTLDFTPPQQASYMRSTCLTAKILSAQTRNDPFLEHLIEGDLSELQTYHGQPGLVVRRARIAALTVHVPPSHIVERGPLAVRIDFDHLRQTMEKSYPVGADGRLYFSASILVKDDTRQATWELPIEAIPSGLVILREGDDQYDRFLRVSAKV